MLNNSFPRWKFHHPTHWISVRCTLNNSVNMTTFYLFLHSHIATFSFFQFSYNIICACYVYMFCLQRWAVYIWLSWNKNQPSTTGKTIFSWTHKWHVIFIMYRLIKTVPWNRTMLTRSQYQDGEEFLQYVFLGLRISGYIKRIAAFNSLLIVV